METLSENALLLWLDQSHPSPSEHRLRREMGGEWRYLVDAGNYFQCSTVELLSVARTLKGLGFIGCMAGNDVELNRPVEILRKGRALLSKIAAAERLFEAKADRRRNARRQKKIVAQKMYYEKNADVKFTRNAIVIAACNYRHPEADVLTPPTAESKVAKGYKDKEWWCEPALPDALNYLACALKKHGGKADAAELYKEMGRTPADICYKNKTRWGRWLEKHIEKPDRGIYQLRVQ